MSPLRNGPVRIAMCCLAAVATVTGIAVFLNLRERSMIAAEFVAQRGGRVEWKTTWRSAFVPVPVSVSLRGCAFDDEMASELATWLHVNPSVRKLNLSNTGITDDTIERIAVLCGLESLDLGGTQIADAGLLALQRLPNLKYLSLGGTRITDQGLSRLHIYAFRNLEELSLGDTDVTTLGLSSICHSSTIRILWLGGTGVTDDAVSYIARLPRLETVRFDRYSPNGRKSLITAEGIAKMKLQRPEIEIYYGSGWGGEVAISE